MNPINILHYQFYESSLLGQGSSGKVYLGTDLTNQNKVAIKCVNLKRLTNPVLRFLLENQKQALKQLRSPHIIQLFDIVQDNKFCYIITEYCQGGTLYDYIQRKKKLSQTESLQLIRKIVLGMLVLAKKHIIHRDIKTANIMFRRGQPVIIDFGYCLVPGIRKPIQCYNVGSPAYMSPESFMNNIYSQKSDIWSVGIMYKEMITGKIIKPKTSIYQYFQNLIAFGFTIQQQVSEQSNQFFRSTLNVQPQKRLSFLDLYKKLQLMLDNKPNIKRLSKFYTQKKQSNEYKNAYNLKQKPSNISLQDQNKKLILKLSQQNSRTSFQSIILLDKINSRHSTSVSNSVNIKKQRLRSQNKSQNISNSISKNFAIFKRKENIGLYKQNNFVNLTNQYRPNPCNKLLTMPNFFNKRTFTNSIKNHSIHPIFNPQDNYYSHNLMKKVQNTIQLVQVSKHSSNKSILRNNSIPRNYSVNKLKTQPTINPQFIYRQTPLFSSKFNSYKIK